MRFERLLVTGGAGFIGSNFVNYLMARHPRHRVVVLDALTYAGNRANLDQAESSPQFRFVHGDIRDRERVHELLIEEQLNCIVHFAAESHVDRSILDPGVFLSTNVMGTHNLLQAAREVWKQGPGAGRPHRFHHVSTDEVYGSLEFGEPAFTEASPYDPSSPYAASKAASDHLVRAYGRTYGLDITISNCSNNYGPFHYPEKLIPLMIVNILQGRPLPIYGQGKNVRDWLYVEDHCRGIEAILDRGVPGATYNIGGNCERSNIDLVRTLCRELDSLLRARPDLAGRFPAAPVHSGRNSDSLITFVADRPGHDLRYAIDTSRIEADLGFTPAHDLEAGLQSTLAWYLENEQWWRELMGRDYSDWLRTQYAVGAQEAQGRTGP